MSLVKTTALVLTTLLATASTGCFWKKQPPAPPAAPPPQVKSPDPTVKPAPPPPSIDSKTPDATPPVAVKLPDTPKPPQAKPTPKRPRRTQQQPVAVKPQPAVTPETAPEAAPPPKLGDLLTDTQRADLIRKCDQAIQRARQSLDRLSAKSLPPDAAESMERARVFLQQAEQARTRDPQTALQLAERAEVLARDLLKISR